MTATETKTEIKQISIHALLAESDEVEDGDDLGRVNFYPRSPCGERPKRKPMKLTLKPFLSTLSLRRATLSGLSSVSVRRDFYPRSPCGERRPAHGCIGSADNISIHALLAESDACCRTASSMSPQFLSTLSLRRATVQPPHTAKPVKISIHALLAESDRPGL